MQAAIRDGEFSRAMPGDKKHERLLFLSPSEPFHFISRDEAISIGNMPNVDHARDVIVRMWAPRSALAMLFKKREWRLPAWLVGVSASPLPTLNAPKKMNELDSALYPIMSDLLSYGEATSVAQAARLVAPRAKNQGGTRESVAKRLARGYSDQMTKTS
jgi:hypothetical protein